MNLILNFFFSFFPNTSTDAVQIQIPKALIAYNSTKHSELNIAEKLPQKKWKSTNQ